MTKSPGPPPSSSGGEDVGRYGSLCAFLEAEIGAGSYLDNVRELQEQTPSDDDLSTTSITSARRARPEDADIPETSPFIRMPLLLRPRTTTSGSDGTRPYFRTIRNANQATPTRRPPPRSRQKPSTPIADVSSHRNGRAPLFSPSGNLDHPIINKPPNPSITPSPERAFASGLFTSTPCIPLNSTPVHTSLAPMLDFSNSTSDLPPPEPMTPARWNQLIRPEQDAHLNTPVTLDEIRSVDVVFPRRPGIRPYLPNTNSRRPPWSDPITPRYNPRRHTRRFHLHEDQTADPFGPKPGVPRTRYRYGGDWDPWTVANWHLYSDDENDNSGNVNVGGEAGINDDDVVGNGDRRQQQQQEEERHVSADEDSSNEEFSVDDGPLFS